MDIEYELRGIRFRWNEDKARFVGLEYAAGLVLVDYPDVIADGYDESTTRS
jgi:hypothetical protein